MKQLTIAVAVSAALVAGLAHAAGDDTVSNQGGIQVSPMITVLQGAHKLTNITVKNPSDHTEYVQVTPSIIKNIDTKHQSYINFDPKTQTPEQFGLVVTPRKLVLNPGQTRKIRVVSLHPNLQRDEYYSIDVAPVSGVLESFNNEKNHVETAVNIVVAYRPMVVVVPNNAQPKLTYQRDGKALTVTNTGNSYARLHFARQCNAQGKDCKDFNLGPVYVGQKKTFSLPYNAPVEFKMFDAKGVKPVKVS